MRITTRLACLPVLAVPFFAVSAFAQAGVGVSGSATVQVGGGQPQPPPPVVYQPAPAAAPPPAYASAPPAYAAPPPPPPPPGEYELRPRLGAFVHDGFFLRMAIGGGWLGGSANLDTQSNATVPDYSLKGGGVALDFQIGGAVVPGVILGGELAFQQAINPTLSQNGYDTNSNAKFTMNFVMLGPFIDWYPDPKGGFHFGGMIGLAGLTTTDPDADDQTTSSAGGFGGGVHIGYDWWVAPEWSVGVLAKFWGASVKSSGNDVSNFGTGFAGVSADERWSVGSFSLLFSVLYN